MSVHGYLVTDTGITTSRPGTSRRAGTTAVPAVACLALGAVAAGEPFSDLLAGPPAPPGDDGPATTAGSPTSPPTAGRSRPRPTASSAHPA